jgi:hypothetical protein
MHYERGMRRTRGRPTSSNGASSLHLRWVWEGGEPDLVEVSATLTVLDPTPNDDLRFWALQAGFTDRGKSFGAGHVGLQRHAGHPGSCAANWGGYAAGGGELDGTTSPLPSARSNRNTRDFMWVVGRPYRLTVRRGDRGWAGLVDDVELRQLHAGGDRLTGVVVWSEVFARCEDPPHAVRWSDLAGRTGAGAVVHPVAVSVNYQAWSAGGCTNTDASLDGAGVVQRTGVKRRTPQGSLLRLSPSG